MEDEWHVCDEESSRQLVKGKKITVAGERGNETAKRVQAKHHETEKLTKLETKVRV